jgi:Xaa-Pro aminopeptidase
MQNEERLANLQAKLSDAEVDLVAINPTANMLYLLGFAPHADERLCALLINRQSICMLVPSLNLEEVAAHTKIALTSWEDAEGPQKALQQLRTSLKKPHKLAVDSTMRADHLLLLQDAFAPSQTIAADVLLAPLRTCKTAPEIDALKQAALQADMAMQVAIDACHPGISEAEVAWETEAAFRRDGAEQVCFTLIASGPNGAFPHHHSGERKLQKGDAIVIDIGASLEGYKSDITRMVHLGKPSAEFLQAYNAVLEANQQAMAAVKPGVAAEDIDRQARSALENAAYGQYFTHRTGHGIGLDGHEPPYIMAGNKTTLKEGMVFSIEPGVYFNGRFGVRIEDIVAVTQTDVECLTGFDRSLVIRE